MARTRTLAELRAEVRQRADVENDPHISDSELTRYINQSCTAMHALLVDLDQSYFMASMTPSTVAGVETVSLSDTDAAVYKVLHVEALVSGVYRSLRRWTFEERTIYRNVNAWGYPNAPLSYRVLISGDKTFLTFAPVPDAAYPLVVSYVKSFTNLSADSDTFNGLDGWEEWVIWDSAIKCLVKEESDIREATAERDRVMARIAGQMATPDLDHPPTIRDTASSYDAVWPRRGMP